MEDEVVDPADIIRIMIATDNHLGYGEKDAVRGEDSFTAFEEILEMAVTEDVDFILLGGDLFHDAVPSQYALHKCMHLLRRYTFGDKAIAVEFLSDDAVNFHSALNQSVNYYDPNFNISIPVFSIHGNHDDPSGFGRLSSLDLLSTSGLVNYFGRWTDLTKVEINPILLRKGQTQLALYGLSHIHDARLARLADSGKVVFGNPSSDVGEWFNLMVLHQNRADRGPKNYLPEELLPEFLNLIIWGHEHDCRIEPEFNGTRDFYVSQPGSSVPTSLAEGEALKKHVGLLEIHKTTFQMKPLPLKTVRPFIFESVNLWELIDDLHLDEGDASNKIRLMAEERIEVMIERSKELLTGHPQQPTLPLIRLRLNFTEEQHMFNAIRFGQMFNERVANPADMIHFKKVLKKSKKEPGEFDKQAMDKAFKEMEIDTNTRVEDLVDRYFHEVNTTKPLQLMPSKLLSEMCYRLVDRRDNNAAENIIKFYKEKAVNHLMSKLPNEDGISEELLQLKDTVTHDDVLKMLDERGSKSTTADKGAKAAAAPKGGKGASNDFLFDDKPTATTSTRGRGRAVKDENNTTKTTTARGRGRGAKGVSAASSSRAQTGRSAMPQLNVSVGSSSTRSTRQKTLLDTMGDDRPTKRKAAMVYEISDSE